MLTRNLGCPTLFDALQLCERLGGSACATATANKTALAEGQFRIFPSPSGRNVTVYFPGSLGLLTLTDCLGRVVAEYARFVPGPLNLEQVVDGTYLLRLVTQEGQVFTKKIIRQE